MTQTSIYLPFAERKPDSQYHDLLQKIMSTGRLVDPFWNKSQKAVARMICGHEMRFRIGNGFPAITERDMSGKYFLGASGEHLAFVNGVHTHEELVKWGCPYWKKWVTKEKCAMFGLPAGDLGPGSYGPGWTRVPTPDGRFFNQIECLMETIEAAKTEGVSPRTLEMNPWIPFYALGKKRQVVVAPCHGWIHVHFFPNEKEIVIEHRQRSADAPVGLAFNMIQYAIFGLMLQHLTGYKFTELVYWISDAHIYESWLEDGKEKSQIKHVAELLIREPRILPRVWIEAPDVKTIFDFRPEHFKMDEYNPHPEMFIPTPI